MSFRFKANKPQLSAADIGALRRHCGLSIAEIKSRAAADLALVDIAVFSGEWPTSKRRLVAILAAIEQGELPLRPLLVQETSSAVPTEEELTVAQTRSWLQEFREIALEQDMHQQLEQGYIKTSSEYVPRSDDEA